MPAGGLLPDTCAWIDFFQPAASSLARHLEKALAAGPVMTCGPVLAELVQGAAGARDRDRLLNAMKALVYLEMTPDLWIRAGELGASLRRKGITVPFSDLCIAALALEHDLTVLTVDRHFGLIPGVRVRS